MTRAATRPAPRMLRLRMQELSAGAGSRLSPSPQATRAGRSPWAGGSLSLAMGSDAHNEPPRLRDLPMPRRATGVIAPIFRVVFAWPYRAALLGFYRAGVRPWQLTFASFLNNVVVGWLLLTDRRVLPGILLLPAGLLDIFDGG